MSIKVFKVGGEVGGNPDNIRKLADLIQKEDQVVLVTSAPAKNGNRVTDLLREGGKGDEIAAIYNHLAQPFGETFQPREFWKGIERAQTLDDVVYRGDAYQAKLMVKILKNLGVDSKWIDAHHVINTDSNYGNGKIDWIDIEPFKGHRVYVIGGFHGANSKRETIILPPSGSDITAGRLAGDLKADELIMLKEQPGLRFVDPKILPETAIIDHLTYEQMREAAYRSGKAAVHPSALKECRDGNIPILIRSLDSGLGTIINRDITQNRSPIVGFAVKDGFLIYKLQRELNPDFFTDVFNLFKQERISLDMVESDSDYVSIAVHNDEFADRHQERSFVSKLKEAINQQVEERRNQTLISVVGGQIYDPLMVRSIFSSFDPNEIYGIMTGKAPSGVTYLDIELLGMNEIRGYSKRLFDFFKQEGKTIVSASTSIDTFSVGITGVDPVHLDDLCYRMFKAKLADNITQSKGYKLGGTTRKVSNITLAFQETESRKKLRRIYDHCEREGFIPKPF